MLPNLWQLAPGQRVPVFGGHSPAPSVGFAFDPLDLDPVIALSLDATNVQTEGGGQAGYLDPVAGITNPGTASDPTQGTSLAQPIYLWDASFSKPFLHLPGVNDNGATIPNEAALNITGDVDVRALVTRPDWGSSVGEMMVVKGGVISSNIQYRLYFTTSNRTVFQISDGTDIYSALFNTPSLTPGASYWLRGKWDSVGKVISLEYSTDNETWTLIGSSAAEAAAINTSASAAYLGMRSDGNNAFRGAIHRVQIFASTDGTDKRLDIDFSKAKHGDTSFVCDTNQTVSINQSGDNPAIINGFPGMRGDGVEHKMSGTAAEDISTFPVVSVYRNHTSGVFGVRRDTVANEPIITNTGTDWTILDGVASDLRRLYVFPADTDSGDLDKAVELLEDEYNTSEVV